MWIFTTNSFVSVVMHPVLTGMVVVRGRAKGDVIRFLSPALDADNTLIENEAAGTDYAVRIDVDTETFLKALTHWGSSIDYTNFKNAVQENVRHDAYMGVWCVMNRFQNWLNPIVRGTGPRAKKRLGKGKSMSSMDFR